MRPPMRNLGPAAEPWGRWVDDSLDRLEKTSGSIVTNSRSDGSVQNAGMDNMAIKIKELYARQSYNLSSPTLQTDSFGPISTSPWATRTITLPRPSDAERIGWMSIQGIIGLSGTQAMSSGYVEFLLDGVLIGNASKALPPTAASTPGWADDSEFALAAFSAEPSSGGSLQIRLQGRGLAEAGSRSVTFSNIRITAQYGQKVA